jgi:Fur family transcriptional regulator, peroxide stress response regulator
MSRKSKRKDAILKVVMNTNSHPKADWVYEQVRKEIPNISMGTVYRNLKSLAEAGEILQLEIAGDTRRYDGNTESHIHFRCKKCGCMLDLEEPVDHSIEKKLAKKTGLEITRQRVELVGLCKKCQSHIKKVTEK